METTIHSTSLIRRTKDQVSSTLDNEVILLNISSGNYFNLNEVGSRIWELLDQPRTLESICTHLLQEFAIDSETCQKATTEFLMELMNEKLVEIADS